MCGRVGTGQGQWGPQVQETAGHVCGRVRPGQGHRGGTESRESRPGVSGDILRTRYTGTMVWQAGALLSIVSNFLVTWLSRGVTSLDALLLGTLQCPFDLHMATALLLVSPSLPELCFPQ